MSAKCITSESEKIAWNRLAPHPLVSWEWGEARKAMGTDVVRLGTMRDSKLTDVFQVTFHRVPYTQWTVGYMPRTRLPSADILDLLKAEANKRSCLFVKVEPYIRAEEVPASHTYPPSPHPLFPQWSQEVDVTAPEDELFARLKPKWRYNVRLARKKGVVVKEVTTQEGFEMFAKLYFATTNRQRYHGHNLAYHQTIFDHLSPAISSILVAMYKEVPLAAYHLFTFNNRTYYPYGGSSDVHKDFMASNLLMWESLIYAKNRGSTVFDMWGSLPPEYHQQDPWAGFTRFKEGFGSTFVRYIPGFDIVLRPQLYAMYNGAHMLRKLVLSLQW